MKARGTEILEPVKAKNPQAEMAKREAKRKPEWRRGWNRVRKIEIEAVEAPIEPGEDYYGALSNPDEEIGYDYGYRFLDLLDELERPSHWGVAV